MVASFPVSFRRFLLVLCLVFAGGGFLPAPVLAAQTGDGVVLSIVETAQFPQVQFYFETYDEGGRFIEDLQPEEIHAVEDDAALPLVQLEKFEPGVQFITAFNVAPVFLNQSGGVSLYAKIQEALAGWASTQEAGGLNDYSLAANTGLQAIRLSNPQDFASAVMAYQPDLLTLQPSAVSLSHALDLATDPNPTQLMKRTIIYITALPVGAQVTALPSMADRAAQLGVRLNVWLVGYPGQESTTAGETLRQMAERTSGSFFMYTGLEQFPDLQDNLQPLRYTYRGSYLSGIRQSGSHRLSVQVNRGGLTFSSRERTFNLNVLPPNPVFINPPTQVLRAWSEPENKKEGPRLQPAVRPLQFLVEFPDGYPRLLAHARLLVDGKIVAEKAEPPFDSFDWPLGPYTETGTHRLIIQVEDQLGLGQQTVEIPVQVVVEQAQRGLFNGLIPPERLIIAAALLAASGILAVVLLRARRRPRTISAAQSRKAAKDPLTQPVQVFQERALQRKAAEEPKSQPRPEVPMPAPPPAPARLIPLASDEQGGQAPAIPLSRNQISFGSDPAQAVICLNDPSVSKLHARLHHTADGRFVLNDAGSIAGVWVNYTLVSTQGVQLKHGDLIHFGRSTFRFELSNPGIRSQPVTTPYSEELS
ncbi:MAG: FHA domain-containing protein [Anaerolineaceae bacterium]|nr:FHA domain-containing protein [Anaerolineaceae bacterium]